MNDGNSSQKFSIFRKNANLSKPNIFLTFQNLIFMQNSYVGQTITSFSYRLTCHLSSQSAISAPIDENRQLGIGVHQILIDHVY